MNNDPAQIEQIKSAQTLDDIRAVARTFSAQAQGNGGIFYSGYVGEIRSEVIARELAHKTNLAIINDTSRARFLSDEHVEKAIGDSAERIWLARGMSLGRAENIRSDFLYGNGKLPPENPLSTRNSLWGEASAEFAASLRGPVVVVASAANAERVLGQVEVPTVLQQLGPLPGAVTDALHAPTNTLGASDGHTYIRDTQGRWSTPGRLCRSLPRATCARSSTPPRN
ncbi:hypothetical protein [Rhodanobacter lindaniclasticus]